MNKEDESIETNAHSLTKHIDVNTLSPDEVSVSVNSAKLAPPVSPDLAAKKQKNDIVAELEEAAAQIPDEYKHASPAAEHSDLDSKRAKKKKAPLVVAIILVLAAIGAAAFFVVKGDKREEQQVVDEPETNNPLENTAGVWQSNAMNGSCYMFSNDTFYWRGNCTIENNNYMYGTREVKRGDDALAELGVDYDGALKILNLSKGVANSDIYSVILHPSHQIFFDQTSDSQPKAIKMLFVVTAREEAYGYRQDTGDSYVFFKRDDIKIPDTTPALIVGE